jgi:hypothetical protein
MITEWLSAARAAFGAKSGTVRVLAMASVVEAALSSAKSGVDQVASRRSRAGRNRQAA